MGEALLLVGDSMSDQNLYYKTHFLAGDPFIYLEPNGRRMLIIGDMEKGRAEKESVVSEIRTYDDYKYRDLAREKNDQAAAFGELLVRILADVKAKQITVGARFPVFYADYLRERNISVSIDPKLMREERRHKTPEEVRAIEKAQRATERATRLGIDLLKACKDRNGVLFYKGAPFTSEQLRGEIEMSLLQQDMDTSHSPIVAGGPGAADPHWEGSGPLKTGEAIILDVFPRSKKTRYCADMTRTVVKGEPPKLLKQMYASVLKAQKAALAKIRAGVNGREVHEAVTQVFAEDGFDKEDGPRYTHGTGHGVGLDIHEPPGMSIMDVNLEEGDVVTVEPGLYDPKLGAVRIEDMVLVTKGGSRNLTRFSKRFEVD